MSTQSPVLAYPRGVNALRDYKLALLADPAEGAIEQNGRTMPPTFKVGVKDNQPYFVVYTNVKDDANKGVIEANMDLYTFGAVMAAVKAAAVDPNFATLIFQNKGYFYGANGRSEQPGVKSQTVVGRDSDGNVFIALTAKNRPNIRFRFLPSEWHNLIDAKGNPVPNTTVSSLYASGYASVIELLVVKIVEREYITNDDIKARKEANKNNGGKGGWQGGGNRSGGAGGGFNRNAGGGGSFRNNNSSGGSGGAAAAETDFDADVAW
jgi:hypothetical protein